MTRIVLLLIVVLFAWSLWLYLPASTINSKAFKYDDHLPYWMDFSPELLAALDTATAPDTTIGIVGIPNESKIAVFWNSRRTNRVEQLANCWPECIDSCDYLYLRPLADNAMIEYCNIHYERFRCLIEDDWGYIYEVKK